MPDNRADDSQPHPKLTRHAHKGVSVLTGFLKESGPLGVDAVR